MQNKTTKIEPEVITIDIQPFLTPIAIIIGAIIIGVTNLIGPSGGSSTSNILTPTKSPNEVANELEEFPQVKTTLDDDPVLGNKETAQIAIIEFTDYECSFCKRHFSSVHKELIKKYVDTGKAIIVMRDMPINRHDPLATFEAMAGECVQESGGDQKYFDLHDLIFSNTASGGNGLTEDQIYQFVEDIGLNSNTIQECIKSEKFKDEIQKDITDAQELEITGTPGFIVGRFDENGNVEGKKIGGAYPLEQFEKIIEEFMD